MRIRVQTASKVLMTKNWKKIYSWQKKLYPILQEKPSALKREHSAHQNMTFLYNFLLVWVIFALLDPDPATQFNADPWGYGSESESKTLASTFAVWAFWLQEELQLGFLVSRVYFFKVPRCGYIQKISAQSVVHKKKSFQDYCNYYLTCAKYTE